MSFVLPAERLERRFKDKKPAYTPAQAVAEATRCLYCHDAPCIRACPTSIPIPEFIRKIGSGNVKGSARTILTANILGYSCARVCPVEVLCEGACVYHDRGQPPIEIGRLQRYSTDLAYAKGWRFHEAGNPTGRKVALVGGGPASISCAHELRVLGHGAVVFESRAYLGGLNTGGVAPYKMQADASLAEAAWVLGIGGVEVRTGRTVGEDPGFAELEKEFDAIFLGMGLGADSRLGIPGEDLPGVIGAVALIERLKLGAKVALDGVHRAAVIGGGNTAIDAARQLKGLGVPEVYLVYRRGEAEMPGYTHEWMGARKEGVFARFLSQPVAVRGRGKVESLTLIRMALGKPDQSGRRRPEPLAGSEHELPVDLVVAAAGQEKLVEQLKGIRGIEVRGGKLVVDPATGATGNPRYFAGGDCVSGGQEVVNASAEGKLAARGIDIFLRTTKG